jgi:hypothetical protein
LFTGLNQFRKFIMSLFEQDIYVCPGLGYIVFQRHQVIVDHDGIEDPGSQYTDYDEACDVHYVLLTVLLLEHKSRLVII